MRTLRPAPLTFVDPATRRPMFGSYSGRLPCIELDTTRVRSLFRRKKWVWLAIGTDEVWVSLGVVRMGYASSAFVFVYDLQAGKMVVDRTLVAPPFAAEVADDPHGVRRLARFGFAGPRIVLARHGDAGGWGQLELHGRLRDLEIDATFDESAAPPAIAAIAALEPRGSVLATEKRALVSVRGRVVAAGRPFTIEGGLGGYDYTHGLMPRRTRWKWAFAMGRLASGEPVAFNVVEGFVGEAECAAFLRGSVHPIGSPHFEFDRDQPTKSWRLLGEHVNVEFDVGGVHQQHTNLGLARSRFLQPVGTFRGTMTIGGEALRLDGVPGVVEDQDVLW